MPGNPCTRFRSDGPDDVPPTNRRWPRMTADRRTHGPPVTRDDACCRFSLNSAGHGHTSAQTARTRAVEGSHRGVAAPARASRPGARETAAAPSYHGMLAVDIKGFND